MTGEGQYRLEKPVEETVLYEKLSSEIARITLNRPEKHNAYYPPDMLLEIRKKLDMVAQDNDVKVAIIRGAGPSFCTGDDLNRTPYEAFGGAPGSKPTQSARLEGFHEIGELVVRNLIFCPKILIAQVHGWAIEGGLWFVLCSDIAIAGESAKFARYGQRIGFGGMESWTLAISLLTLGAKRTREWDLTGKAVNAAQALEWGLVNAVVPDEKLEEETLRWANAIASQAGDGLMIGKIYYQLVLEALGMGVSLAGGTLCHTLFTNLRWRENESNFLKLKAKAGTSQAFKEREGLWAKFGF